METQLITMVSCSKVFQRDHDKKTIGKLSNFEKCVLEEKMKEEI